MSVQTLQLPLKVCQLAWSSKGLETSRRWSLSGLKCLPSLMRAWDAADWICHKWRWRSMIDAVVQVWDYGRPNAGQRCLPSLRAGDAASLCCVESPNPWRALVIVKLILKSPDQTCRVVLRGDPWDAEKAKFVIFKCLMYNLLRKHFYLRTFTCGIGTQKMGSSFLSSSLNKFCFRISNLKLITDTEFCF
jgi:hypothetical protein